MKERPILFSAPMVRAILEGRKTQTRRAVRKQFVPDAEPAEVPATSPEGWQISGHSGLWWDDAGACIDDAIRCPYGQPGDRLWVRETWAYHVQAIGSVTDEDGQFVYRADRMAEQSRLCDRWRPSILMPRRASRILLEVVSVRVERLNEISPADCVCEGYDSPPGTRYAQEELNALDWYRELWEDINGPGSWAANPWVWVVEFKRVQP